MKKSTQSRVIKSFRLAPGTPIGDNYEVVEFLGNGWEGEVYKLRELGTGIEHAGKFFFPHRDERIKTIGIRLRLYETSAHFAGNQAMDIMPYQLS